MTAAGGYLVGVDTGGTFTDAAVISASSHEVLATAKAITTKGDLAIGVTEAIAAAVAGLPASITPQEIALVSVSTTLATNAVVEGHGDEIGVVLIGFDAGMAERTRIGASFPGCPVILVGGGHDHTGTELAPLALDQLDRALGELQPVPAAFAVSSTFATRNPEHEQRAASRIRAATGRPVTVSSELSSGLDAPRRALTAALNARLLGRVAALVAAVRRAMATLELDCPLMLVKGDGSVARAEAVELRPIETILSGPAASLVGARWLSGLDDFLLADMGGTTTDLGIVRNGRPRVAEHGAEIGGWRTMVRAVDARTIGLGGDSEVLVEGAAITIAPRRVVPLALAAARHPELLGLLEADLADVRNGGALHGRFVMRPFGSGERADPAVAGRAGELLDRLGTQPVPLRAVVGSSRSAGLVDTLRRAGLVQLVGFTPSDAAHVLGHQATWNRDAAVLGARLGARLADMRPPTPERTTAFAERVWHETVARSTRAVLETALGADVGASPLVDAVCAGDGTIGSARVAVVPMMPVIAVGGPVRVFYPEVGRRLGVDTVFPSSFDVANAVGAATGVVVRTVTAEIHGDGSGRFRLHGPGGVDHRDGASAALAAATAAVIERARLDAAVMGAGEPDVHVSERRQYLPGRTDDDGLLLVVVTAEAVGRPLVTG